MYDSLIFDLTDVRMIRKVSVNIDDFDMYAQEVQRNYLQKLLGDKLYTAMILAPEEARFSDLINGTIYEDGRDVIFRGLKIYCSYLWLYLYINDSEMNITPLGARIFKDDQADVANTKLAREHYIKSADGLEEPILRFLEVNNATYPEFSESYKVEQAKKDNMTFSVIGRSYTAPKNYFD